MAEANLPPEPPSGDPVDERGILAMSVKYVVIDPRNQTPIVVLMSEDEKYSLPIWIGPYEATAIIMALEDVELPRPMTHDLVREMLIALDVRLDFVVIHEIKNGTFFAEMALRVGDRTVSVDARPSDSIALALRMDAPILAEKAVCDDADAIDRFLKEAQAEQYKTFLENLDPGQLNKYKI